MRVTVEAYNPQWTEQFDHIKARLEDALLGVSYVSIEHVGSTSVPGLAAKPVIDIDVVVQRQHLPAVIDALTNKGGYRHMGDLGIPEREAFRMHNALPARNVYVCIEGSRALRNHLAVRDICTQDKFVRDAYASKKLELARQDWLDTNAYAEAKTSILQWILHQAGISEDDLNEIRKQNSLNTPK